MRSVEKLIDQEYDKFMKVAPLLEPGDKHTVCNIVDSVIDDCTNSFQCYLVVAVLSEYLKEYGADSLKEMKDPAHLARLMQLIQEERDFIGGIANE